MIRSILWKELRENLKWAAAGFLAIAIAFGIGLGPQLRFGERAPNGSRVASSDAGVLASEAFLVAVWLAVSGFGLLLGILQVAPESRGDRWALLVHRPVHRSAIFLGKAAVGLAYYLAAAGAPLLLCVAWAAAPGSLPGPFSARTVLPALALIAAGCAYYFAGMLAAIRQARWYGSRGLGVGLALLASIMTADLPSFPLALLAALSMAAVLGLAAWGSFQTGGGYAGQPRVARAALGLSVLSGIALLIGALAAGTDEGIQELQDHVYASHELDRSGRVRRIVYRNYQVESADVLGGEPAGVLAEPASIALVPRREDEPFFFVTHYWRDHGALPVYLAGDNWYYLPSRGLVSVYDACAPRWKGYVGLDALDPSPEEPARRFGPGGWTARSDEGLLAFPDAVYAVVGGGFRLKKVYTAAGGDPVVGAARFPADDWSRSPGANVVVATRKTVQFLSADGEVLLRVEQSPEAKELPYVMPASLDRGRFALWYRSYQWALLKRHGDDGERSFLQIVDRSGKEESAEWLTLQQAGQERYRMSGPIWAAALPPVWQVLCLFEFVAGEASTSGVNAAAALPFVSAWPLALLVALLSGLLAFAIARRHAFPAARQARWGAWGFLFGPAGLLTLISLEEWPARETCASCGRRRAVNRATCHHCQASWPAPVPDGTEIFA